METFEILQLYKNPVPDEYQLVKTSGSAEALARFAAKQAEPENRESASTQTAHDDGN